MHYKQNNKESKTFVQGLRSFGNTLPRGVKGILKKNGYNYSEIISKWSMLVGKDISSCSYPKSIKMKKGNTNGTLLLTVKRGDEITVEYSKKEIINKINSYFGYKIIDKIRIETFEMKTNSKKNRSSLVSGASKNRYLKNINNINNELIKNSLINLTKYLK